MLKRLSEIVQIFSKAQSILKSDIEFIGLINDKGRIHELISRNEFSISKEKLEMFLMGVSLQTRMQQDYDMELGSVKHSIMLRGKTKIIAIPVFLGTIVMITDVNVDHLKIMQKIMKPGDYDEIFSTPIPTSL